MVPHVPVCTYAHVGEDNMQFAECIYKKNWDQVGPGPARLCRVPEGQRAEENEGNARTTSPPKRTHQGPPLAVSWAS